VNGNEVSFEIARPVQVWNRRLGVEYPGVFKGLLKALIHYMTGNAGGTLTASLDALASFKIQSQPLEPPVLAWHLVRRALALAMAQLTVERLQDRPEVLRDAEGLVAKLDAVMDATVIRLDRGFFDRPGEIALMEPSMAQFGEWLKGLGLDTTTLHRMSERLPTYFVFALHEEWARHPDLYTPIDAALKHADTPFAWAIAKERAWLKNSAFLQRQVQEPMFNESFGLEKVYVPLRAWFALDDVERREREPSKRKRQIVDLEKHLSTWLNKRDRKDAIRVICGGPGSGKSSFAKHWAAKLARSSQHRVLYVPLHRVDDFQGDAQRALAAFLGDWKVLPHDPFDPNQGEFRLLILFDGLDEVAMQGRAGRESAHEFVRSAKSKVERVNEQSGLLQVMFGGRDVVVDGARNLFEEHQILHILPYHGPMPLDAIDRQALLDDPQYGCDLWWRQWGAATGLEYSELPEDLRQPELAELTGQPLLNYLLAVSLRRGALHFSRALSLNQIYDDLLGNVYERGWGVKRHPTAETLKRCDFDKLLEELALAAWHGAGRTITEAEVERACERADLKEQLQTFKEGARAGAINLLAAFYFRQAGKIEGGERTFEFTHKSFGEYLTARRLVRAIEDLYEDRVANRKSRQRGKTEEGALEHWTRLTGPSSLDPNLLNFFYGEITCKDLDPVHELVRSWQEMLVELFNDQLLHGLPMQKLSISTYQEMRRQARNAEETLLAAMSACAHITVQHSIVAWPTTFAFGDLLRRLSQDGATVFLGCLDWLAGNELYHVQVLSFAYLGTACLQETDLEEASLEGAYLSSADLSGANLTCADLLEARLVSARLCYACLADAELSGADLEEADLAKADLRGANFAGANLKGASFEGALGIDQADFTGAKIERRWVAKFGLDPDSVDVIE
jgi:Pentapeptide repeats (8 copies)/NACHT domain